MNLLPKRLSSRKAARAAPRVLGHQPVKLSLVVLGVLFWSAGRGAAPDDAGMAKFIVGLPKAELHVHLEGTMEPELYLQIAKRNGIVTSYTDAAAVRNRLRDARDLPSFIKIYEELIGAIRTGDDLHDIALAYFRKAHSQGVLHSEVYFDVQLHLEHGLALPEIFAGLERARQEARREFGLDAGFIMSFLRDRPAQDALQILEATRPWHAQILGIGLDNPEVKDFPSKFKAVYARAASLGLHRTSHCDVDQADTVAHHWGALDTLGVERIDHGLNVLDDPRLVEAVRARRIGLAAAPTLFYTDIPGRMTRRAGAIKKLLEAGLLVSVNSDDPGMKRSLYVSDLMLLVQRETGMTRDELAQLARNSFTMAWIGEPQRRAWLAQVDRYVHAAAEHGTLTAK